MSGAADSIDPATPLAALGGALVDDALLADVISPYKPNCRFLRRASVEYTPFPGAPARNGSRVEPEAGLARSHGEFEIPGSWYIDETGHFNSIEFNICYNQLVYVLMAQCVVDGAVEGFDRMTLAEYRRRQLPDILIAKMSSAFRKPIASQSFRGLVTITSVAERRGMLLVKTDCRFSDDSGGRSEGEITLAIVDSSNRRG